MKTDKLKSLRNEVHIQNEYRRVAAPILERVKELSKQFIGKKIVTLKGLSAKYTDVVSLPREEREAIKVKPVDGAKWASVQSAYVRESYKSMLVEIKLCFSDGGHGCFYEERSWYFGKTDENGILLSVDDDCKVSADVLDYNTELMAIKKYLEAQRLADIAEEEIQIGKDAYKYISLEDF